MSEIDGIEVKVQKMKTRPKNTGGHYYSYWVILPKQLCQVLGINENTTMIVNLENGDLKLTKKE